jgi:hypothetical protein
MHQGNDQRLLSKTTSTSPWRASGAHQQTRIAGAQLLDRAHFLTCVVLERLRALRAFKTLHIIVLLFAHARRPRRAAGPTCATAQSRLGRDQMSEKPSSPSTSTSVA